MSEPQISRGNNQKTQASFSGDFIELRSQDLKDVLTLSGAALECRSLDELQDEMLPQMQRKFAARSSIYFNIHTDARGRSRFLHGSARGVPNWAPQAWCDCYQPDDPFVNRFLTDSMCGTTIVSTDIVTHRDLVSTEFYADFLRPQSVYHVLVLGLLKNAQPIGLFGFHRPIGAPAFDERDKATAILLGPLLAGAVEKTKAEDLAVERQWVLDTLSNNPVGEAIIIVDHTFEPIYVSTNAAAHLCQKTGLQTSGNDWVLPEQIYQGCRLSKQTLNEGSGCGALQFDLKMPVRPEPVSVQVRPYDCGSKGLRFMICLSNGSKKRLTAKRCQQYGFTRREICVIDLVSVGMTNAEIADKLCISVRTVQNHLRAIYGKADVHNRTSLVCHLSAE